MVSTGRSLCPRYIPQLSSSCSRTTDNPLRPHSYTFVIPHSMKLSTFLSVLPLLASGVVAAPPHTTDLEPTTGRTYKGKPAIRKRFAILDTPKKKRGKLPREILGLQILTKDSRCASSRQGGLRRGRYGRNGWYERYGRNRRCPIRQYVGYYGK